MFTHLNKLFSHDNLKFALLFFLTNVKYYIFCIILILHLIDSAIKY